MPCPQYSDRRSARFRSVAATSTASCVLGFLCLGAELVLEHRLARLAARQRRCLGVDGADRGADHPDLPRVQAAHHHLVQREQERDLLPRDLRRIRHVPRVERVGGVVRADLDLLRPVQQPGERLVVAGPVDHEPPGAGRQAAREQHVGGHRLAGPERPLMTSVWLACSSS